MKYPKILVGCPIWNGKDYIIERYVNRLKELDYPNYDILLVDNTRGTKYLERVKKLKVNCVKAKWSSIAKQRIVNSRNVLRDYTLKNNYDYYFSLEEDIIPPKHILKELLSHNKKVVGGWYFITKNPAGMDAHGKFKQPCVSREWTMINMRFGFDFCPMDLHMAKNRLMKCYLASMGVLLIHRSVLEKVKFRLIPEIPHADDTWFFYDLDKKGIEVFVDTDLLVPHFQSSFPKRNVFKI